MGLSKTALQNIAQLAYLDCESETSLHLEADLNSIMNLVEQLRQIDTTAVEPLFHPLELGQRFREDEVTASDCSAKLAKLTPFFKEGYYLVPKVIDSGQ